MRLGNVKPHEKFMYNNHVYMINPSGGHGGGYTSVKNMDTGEVTKIPGSVTVELVDMEDIAETVEHHQEVLKEKNADDNWVDLELEDVDEEEQ